MEIVENCVFEAVPFKKSSHPKRFKGKLFKALMPTILYLFIFWKESFCNSGVVYRRILKFPLLRFYNYHLGLKTLPQLHHPRAC